MKIDAKRPPRPVPTCWPFDFSFAAPGTSALEFREEHMKLSTTRSVFSIALLAVLIMVSASIDAMGQGRGRRASRFDRKCDKFVNCHDARDGRWDGRGPNRRSDYSNRYWRRHRRNRDRDRDWDDRMRRRRHRDRDRDRDFDRFDRDRDWWRW